jgi:hypothetical protein
MQIFWFLSIHIDILYTTPGYYNFNLVGVTHCIYFYILHVIRSRQPAKISGNSSCRRRLLFLFKKNNERKFI